MFSFYLPLEVIDRKCAVSRDLIMIPSAEVDMPRIMETRGKIRHEGRKRKLKLNENKMNKPYEVLTEMRQVVSHMTYLPIAEGAITSLSLYLCRLYVFDSSNKIPTPPFITPQFK